MYADIFAFFVFVHDPYISIDPYPFAIDEAFDTYQALVESGQLVYHPWLNLKFTRSYSGASLIGMSGRGLKVIVSGDSA